MKSPSSLTRRTVSLTIFRLLHGPFRNHQKSWYPAVGMSVSVPHASAMTVGPTLSASRLIAPRDNQNATLSPLLLVLSVSTSPTFFRTAT